MFIERYEMKYRIPPDLVEPIRDEVLRYCDPDEANLGGRYIISSLYLDSPSGRLYHETQNRTPRRFKLRVRRYAQGDAHFLEIKRRVKDVIVKSRVHLPGSLWPAAFQDPRLCPHAPGTRKRKDFDEFVTRSLYLHARPSVTVRYEREAFVSRTDRYGRVSFDHRLEGAPGISWTVPYRDGPEWRRLDAPNRYGIPQSGVVLELKTETIVPIWMVQIVRRYGLKREGFSKFGTAVEGCMLPELSLRTPALRWEGR